MPQITLPRETVLKMLETGYDNFYIAKDQGVYVGAGSSTTEDLVITYFNGCDPNKDEFWYEEARAKFGGDDFGEQVPMRQLEMVGRADHIASVTIKVNARSIKMLGNPMKQVPKKVVNPPKADRVSCRQFFINVLTKNPDILFSSMFDLLKMHYPDSKAGSNEKSAKNQFAYYKSFVKRLNKANAALEAIKNS